MTACKLLPVATLALVTLAGCSPKAQNETSEAAGTIAADANATMSEAVNDVDAASDRAFGAAEAGIDNGIEATGNAMEDAGNEITE